MPKASADNAQRREAVNQALSLAIERRDMDMITLAMGNGGDARTLLDAGIAQENMGMINLALDKGADPNTLMFAGIARGRPAGEKLRDFFRELDDSRKPKLQISLNWVTTAIAHGADVNAKKKYDSGEPWAAIHWAHTNFRREIMDELVKSGAIVDTQSPEGTPLMRAVRAGNAKQIEYYLDQGADPTCVCGDTFPMKELEQSQNFMKGKKARLLSKMMKCLPPVATDVPSPAPADPADPMGASHDIEVLKPLELQVPHKPENPAKTFSL